jgi:hypothetical protein
MPDTSYDSLIKFFVNYLPFTPTAGQVDDFTRDLSLVSPYLMEASLVEIKEGKLGRQPECAADWRPAVFKVYNRKVAEHAQLFGMFHSFETAFRSTVAVTLEQHYQHKRWWRPIYDELRLGNKARPVHELERCQYLATLLIQSVKSYSRSTAKDSNGTSLDFLEMGFNLWRPAI